MDLARIGLAFLSPRGKRGALSILIFHRVVPTVDPLFPTEVDAERFDAILTWIGSAFNVLSLEDALYRLKTGTLPACAAAITFDDGYADNYTVALPILQKHGMTATFFVATSFLDGGIMFNDVVIESVRTFTGDELNLMSLGLGAHSTRNAFDRRIAIERVLSQVKYLPALERDCVVSEIARLVGTALPDSLMLSTDQLRDLRAAGMDIGGHTRSHPILARLDDAAALDEIAGGKAILEQILGESVSLFAYHNGKPGADYLSRDRDLVRRVGFKGAVSTCPGVASYGADLYQLPRFTPWDRGRTKFSLRLLGNLRRRGKEVV